MRQPTKRGGKRKGAGRPKGKPQKKVSYKLDAELVKRFELVVPPGLRSSTVERALLFYENHFPNFDEHGTD